MLSVSLSSTDKLILVFAILCVGGLFGIYWQQAHYGNQASVFVQGKFWSSFDLYQDQEIKVPGKLGVSLLQIREGRVRFIESPCPNKLCIHHGWAHQGGEFVACVPNEVAVKILGPDPRFDTINF